MGEPDSLGESLLQWVRTFGGPGRVEAWKNLSDGRMLWDILQEVDDGYFSGDLPEPDSSLLDDWTRRWQNLKHVEKQVSMYYRDICNGQGSVGAVPDLKAIAFESSVPDLEKLIMIILRTAMASPQSNQKMAQRLMSLGREKAMVIAGELRAMEETEYTTQEPASRDESAYQSEQETVEEHKPNGTKANTGLYSDPLLEREEELLQAQATIDKLQASHAQVQRQLQELRQDNERLQEAFDAYRDDIDSKGRKSAGDDAVKKLQRQADNDRAYIDDLESQLQATRTAVEKFERQIQSFKSENEAAQQVKDELQMLKAENEDLNQKIKANENLKKKIQALQEQERANVTMREELKQANERLEDLDRLKQVQASLEKEIIEKRGLIRNQEYQINELTTTRKHAEYEARMLAQKLEAARERHDRDHEAIEELRQKLQDSNIDDSGDIKNQQELNNELAASEKENKEPVPKTDESQHFAEKLALMEQQLEASDTRLKQAAERNAALEEKTRRQDNDDAEKQKVQQQVQDQEMMIVELRKQLDEISKRPKDAPSQDIAVLQRENRLMTTAWYDLSTRLQNNGVSLGRRRQEPKGWINKQRALVGPHNGLVRH